MILNNEHTLFYGQDIIIIGANLSRSSIAIAATHAPILLSSYLFIQKIACEIFPENKTWPAHHKIDLLPVKVKITSEFIVDVIKGRRGNEKKN